MPLSLFASEELSSNEKIVLMTIDILCPDSAGVAVGVQGIASVCGMSQKDCRQALKSLYDKGAIETIIGEEGERRIIAKIYKESYHKGSKSPELDGVLPKNQDQIDYDYIQEQWNAICENLPKIIRWTPARKRKLRSAMNGAGISTPELIKVFKIVSTIDFMSGHNDRKWTASIDWISKSESITKILEGQYSKSYEERKAYELIMTGGDIKQSVEDSFYR